MPRLAEWLGDSMMSRCVSAIESPVGEDKVRLNSARSCREVGSGRWIRLARVNPQRMHRSFGRIVCTAERTGEQHSKHGSSYVHIVLPTLVVCARLLFQDQVQVLDADFQRRNTGCRTDGQVGASDRWKKNVAENYSTRLSLTLIVATWQCLM